MSNLLDTRLTTPPFWKPYVSLAALVKTDRNGIPKPAEFWRSREPFCLRRLRCGKTRPGVVGRAWIEKPILPVCARVGSVADVLRRLWEGEGGHSRRPPSYKPPDGETDSRAALEWSVVKLFRIGRGAPPRYRSWCRQRPGRRGINTDSARVRPSERLRARCVTRHGFGRRGRTI